MRRNLEKLESERYDVLVIGGGIHGAAVARESSMAGYKTALIEKGDFLGATSANSLKIMHGGLRYLQQFNFLRMRDSIRSRNIMMRIDPEHVKPLGFLVPLFGYGLSGREIMKTALAINDWVSYDRNKGLERENFLPKGKVIGGSECYKYIPSLQSNSLRGGGIWYDAIALSTEHLGMEFIKNAFANGASVSNYLKAININIEKEKVKSVIVEDVISGSQFNVKARCLVNAAGPWVKEIQGLANSRHTEKCQWVKGLNIVVNRKFLSKYAICLQGRDKYLTSKPFGRKSRRAYVFVPWFGQTMIGTYYKPFNGTVDDFKIEKKDIKEFIIQINEIYSGLELKLSDVRFYHEGLLPAKNLQTEDTYQLENKTTILNHESPKGLISIKSIKYTTAPTVAKKVLREINKLIGIKRKLEVENKNMNYQKGEAIKFSLSEKDVIYFIEEEMALKLTDVVFRRTGIGSLGRPPKKKLEKIARIMAEHLEWSREKMLEEINEVIEYYSPLQNH